jgi:hypothetical protein
VAVLVPQHPYKIQGETPLMTELAALTRAILPIENSDQVAVGDPERAFIETVTFADAEQILDALHQAFSDDWMGLPVWARNLAYRLACLQRPNDPALQREAAVDLRCFGPDWDGIADALTQRAERLEAHPPAEG